MSVQITRRLKPEEEEVLRKREELAAIRTTLAELELELVDLRGQLAAFEGRYLREVGALYAELDDWKARIAELQAHLAPSDAAKVRRRDLVWSLVVGGMRSFSGRQTRCLSTIAQHCLMRLTWPSSPSVDRWMMY